ncbi:hypothetical protein [Halochromatium salexigens]|uniref:hypothetical protein n=1 Tax=Halochromatium salexigens TaxID=49447 RepID=UPI001912447F|nr:hypothetical protein [Halochromatium salexigens]
MKLLDNTNSLLGDDLKLKSGRENDAWCYSVGLFDTEHIGHIQLDGLERRNPGADLVRGAFARFVGNADLVAIHQAP